MRAMLPVCTDPSAALGYGGRPVPRWPTGGSASPLLPSRGAGLKLGLPFQPGLPAFTRGDQPGLSSRARRRVILLYLPM